MTLGRKLARAALVIVALAVAVCLLPRLLWHFACYLLDGFRAMR